MRTRKRNEPTGEHYSRGAQLLAVIVDKRYGTLTRAADAMGISKGTLSEILAGKRRPNLAAVEWVAEHHGRACPVSAWSKDVAP